METIREYALEQLDAHDETAKTRQAHAMYFLAFSERGEPELTGPDQTAWFDRFELEHDNIREALGWLLQHDAANSVRLSGMLWRFWWTHGHLVEGRRWLDQALATNGGGPPERAKALYGAGGIALEQGDYERAQIQLDAALVEFRRSQDEAGEALALTDLGLLARDRGELSQARALHDQALALRQAVGEKRGIAISQSNLAVIAIIQCDYDLAEMQLTEAFETFRELHDPFSLGAALSMLALENSSFPVGVTVPEDGMNPLSDEDCNAFFAWYKATVGRLSELNTALRADLLNLGEVGIALPGNLGSVDLDQLYLAATPQTQ